MLLMALSAAAQGGADVMNSPIRWLEWTGLHMSPWKIIGLTGALMFGGRWLVVSPDGRAVR